MLHEFLTAHRSELLSRCRAKVSRRASPVPTQAELEYGVPLFLEQLVEALRDEEVNPARLGGESHFPSAALVEGKRTAALHGQVLHQRGYSVEQVVHGYGDLCQSITELATQLRAPVTVREFHTLNRLLDNAIADAVASYGHHSEEISARGAHELHERMGTLAEEQRKLLDTALKALDAVKVGNIGLMGATGTLLEDCLMRLRDLIDKSLPEIRLAAGMTASPAEKLPGSAATGTSDTRPGRSSRAR